MHIHELNYSPDSSIIFEHISNMPYSVFLDSSTDTKQSNRYDVLSATPDTLIETFDNKTKITHQNNTHISYDNPFEIIKQYMPNISYTHTGLPFIGGAIGFFGFDLAWNQYKIPRYIPRDINIPTMCVGIYNWAIIVDHIKKQTWFIQHNKNHEVFKYIKHIVNKPLSSHNKIQPIKLYPCVSKRQYENGFNKIKQHINKGDCYQVNLSIRFSGQCSADPWLLYKKLRKKAPSSFSAYYNMPHGQIICNSPERFIKIQKTAVETKPIKGTILRSKNAKLDQKNVATLLNSKKDQAENLMIVDLMRNDLSKTCIPKTIRVPHLNELLSLPNVHHLMSTVKAELRKEIHPLSTLKHAFPGGSVTGAPKLKAIQITETVEHVRRSIFCGSIGYISFNGNLDSNIIIRSLLVHKHKVYTWAGGGIVADSILEEEYAEIYHKLSSIFDAIT